MVIWVTGLSGSGKTTLCSAVWRLLKPNMPELVLLDGDVVRDTFKDGLGYKEEDRVVQISRVQRIAKLLSDQDLVVLVAALYANPKLLQWNRENFKDYFEVYLEASLETVKHRDVKGLYSGDTKDVVGIDIPWHAPAHPDLVINTDNPENPETLGQHLIHGVPRLTEVNR